MNKLTPRELELIDGMISREYAHAAQAKAMQERAGGNHPMAEKQIKWDMERVTLLEKLRDQCRPLKE